MHVSMTGTFPILLSKSFGEICPQLLEKDLLQGEGGAGDEHVTVGAVLRQRCAFLFWLLSNIYGTSKPFYLNLQHEQVNIYTTHFEVIISMFSLVMEIT